MAAKEPAAAGRLLGVLRLGKRMKFSGLGWPPRQSLANSGNSALLTDIEDRHAKCEPRPECLRQPNVLPFSASRRCCLGNLGLKAKG